MNFMLPKIARTASAIRARCSMALRRYGLLSCRWLSGSSFFCVTLQLLLVKRQPVHSCVERLGVALQVRYHHSTRRPDRYTRPAFSYHQHLELAVVLDAQLAQVHALSGPASLQRFDCLILLANCCRCRCGSSFAVCFRLCSNGVHLFLNGCRVVGAYSRAFCFCCLRSGLSSFLSSCCCFALRFVLTHITLLLTTSITCILFVLVSNL